MTRTVRAHVAFHCSSYLCFVVETVVGGYTMTNTNMSLFDAIHSQRAIRHFSAQPVSDEAIATILNAAIHAPSGGNRQPWRFVVIRDADLKRRLGQWYLAAWQAATAAMGALTQLAQFLAVCRRSKRVAMGTIRHRRGARLCRR